MCMTQQKLEEVEISYEERLWIKRLRKMSMIGFGISCTEHPVCVIGQ
jgi:hypothetical protein